MINQETPDQIGALCTTIVNASEELETLMRNLSEEADSQLAQAAAAFVTEHGNPKSGPLHASYHDAHETLLKAAIAASNIRETAKRATTFRHKGGWWGGLMQSRQQAGDITQVCNASNADGESGE